MPKADAFYRMFRTLAEDSDFEYAMIDGSIVKVHRHGQGAKGGLRARYRALSWQILPLADAHGNLIDFRLLHGQAHDRAAPRRCSRGLLAASSLPTARSTPTGCVTP